MSIQTIRKEIDVLKDLAREPRQSDDYVQLMYFQHLQNSPKFLLAIYIFRKSSHDVFEFLEQTAAH
jgi:hypothetical protein